MPNYQEILDDYKKQNAKHVVNIDELVFDVEPTLFGDGSVTISIANVFNHRGEAEKFLEALKLLCR